MDLFEQIRAWVAPVDWDAVYAAELPRVFNYFRYHGLDDPSAEDLTAVTFEKAWCSRSSYRRDRASVSTWLLRIARNTLVDDWRQRRGEVTLEAAEAELGSASHLPGVEETVQQHEETTHLRQLLQHLPEREREVVALKYGAGWNNRQIAREMSLSESNVGTILHRVVQNLRAQMEDRNG